MRLESAPRLGYIPQICDRRRQSTRRGGRVFLPHCWGVALCLCSWLLAQDVDPSLMSGCGGLPWAANRPTSGKLDALPVVIGWALPGGGGSARQGVLCCRLVLGRFAVVDDDLLSLGCRVSSPD